MGSMDGVALAKAVRKAGGTMQIVFVTGYSDYIAEGYDVEALNYLMKPVDAAKLFDVLDKAVARMRRDSRCLDLQCAEGLMRIPLADIRYLDVRRNYVTVHADRDYTVKRPLGEFEAELGDGFCRVGRAMIVNLRRIRAIDRRDDAATASWGVRAVESGNHRPDMITHGRLTAGRVPESRPRLDGAERKGEARCGSVGEARPAGPSRHISASWSTRITARSRTCTVRCACGGMTTVITFRR